MDIVIISEASNESLHPVTAQLVGAASSLGGQISVICPGGVGSREAARLPGLAKSSPLKGIASTATTVWHGLMRFHPSSTGILC